MATLPGLGRRGVNVEHRTFNIGEEPGIAEIRIADT